MSPHGHHGGGGGGHHGGGGGHHHHGVHHFQHHNHPRHFGPARGTNVVFVGGAGPGYYGNAYYGNTYYGGYGGYFGPSRRNILLADSRYNQCLCVKNQTALRLYWLSLWVSLIIAISLLATISSSCPSGCHREYCTIVYYDYHADDSQTFDCACDDGTCANREATGGGAAQLAFGVLFLLYAFFGFFVAWALQAKFDSMQAFQNQQNQDLERQQEANNDSGIVMSPLRPSVDLDTTRPFAVNPSYTSEAPSSPVGFTAAPPPPSSSGYPFSQYSALSNPSASYPGMTAPPSAPPAPAGEEEEYAYPMAEAVPVVPHAIPVSDSRL